MLYLVHRVPFPPNRGDRIRSYHTLRYLASRARVHLASLADEPVSAETRSTLAALCEQTAIVELPRRGRWWNACWSLAKGKTATEGLFASPRLGRIVDDWAERVEFGAALVFCSSMFQFAALPALRSVPRVVDLVDVDSEKFLEYARTVSWPKSGLYRLEGNRLRRLEKSLPDRSRAITLVSDDEAGLFRRYGGGENVHVVPNGVDLAYFQPSSDREAELRECVFVGVLDYWPNVDGLNWFCREVWPAVRQRHPDMQFRMVGRHPNEAIRKLAQLPGVLLSADVPDVRPFVARATVAVAPLRIARGVQNKVLEAMAMGKAVVASPQAMEGLAVTADEDLICATDASSWIDALGRLVEDRDRRAELGRRARECVERRYAWDACLAPLGDLLGLDRGLTAR